MRNMIIKETNIKKADINKRKFPKERDKFFFSKGTTQFF